MIELIIGGARSGKSAYALNLAKETQNRLNFVATARPLDGEMKDRISRHQAERGSAWNLTEVSMNLSEITQRFDANDTVVVDCLTLWLTNWLCSADSNNWTHEKSAFLGSIRQSSAHWILVSNETGLGVIPTAQLSREFVDESGWLHQQCAAMADSVTMVMFGLPQKLK